MGQRVDCTDCTHYYEIVGCLNKSGTGRKESCLCFVDAHFGDHLEAIDFHLLEDGTEEPRPATLN